MKSSSCPRALGALFAAGALAFGAPTSFAADRYAPPATISVQEQAQGFTPLFTSLRDFHTIGRRDGAVYKGPWTSPAPGEIRFRRPKGFTWQSWMVLGQNRLFGGGSIVTNVRSYRSFHLKVVYRLDERGANNGVITFANEGRPRGLFRPLNFDGAEVQIFDDPVGRASDLEIKLNPFANSGLTGDIEGHEDVPEHIDKRQNPVGQWNELEVIVRDARYWSTIHNGVLLLNEIDSHKYPRFKNDIAPKALTGGAIAFQDHGINISFRNVRIKQL